MRILEVEYWIGDDPTEVYSGGDLHIPRVGDTVLLRTNPSQPRIVTKVIFNAVHQSVDVVVA